MRSPSNQEDSVRANSQAHTWEEQVKIVEQKVVLSTTTLLWWTKREELSAMKSRHYHNQ